MKYSTILVYLLLQAVASNAQDTTLPKETFKIIPHAGKNIDEVILWKIGSNSIEYVKNGNLADINTVDVLRIESLNYRIEINEHQKTVMRIYDLIIIGDADTIRGIIKKINGNTIEYVPAGRNSLPLKSISYKSYIIRNILTEEDTADQIEGQDSTENSDNISSNDPEKKIKIKKEKSKAQKTFKTCCLSSITFAVIIIGLLEYLLRDFGNWM